MEKSIRQVYQEHTGKVSDKWSLYLDEWERLFAPYRDQQIQILEIGIQNGGSLEVWGKYFSNAKKIIGCDIDLKCADLRYEDDRISVVIGDVNSPECEMDILKEAPTFDIIIDDGSHKSSDVVRSFARYFPHLNENGLYVVEDLHSSYWKDFEGSLYNPLSSMAFFKRLADIVNYEHWRNNKPRVSLLTAFAENLGIKFEEFEFTRIHSVEFINSLCIIKKYSSGKNVLGKRVIVGMDGIVTKGWEKVNGTVIQDSAMDIVDDVNLDVINLINSSKTLNTDVEEKEERIQSLLSQVGAQDNYIQLLNKTVAQKEQDILSFSTQIEENRQQLEKNDYLLKEKEQLLLSQRHTYNDLLKQLEVKTNLTDQLNSETVETKNRFENLSHQVDEINRSKVYRFALYLRYVRVKLIPIGSLRERWARNVFRGIKYWRQFGFIPFVRRVVTRSSAQTFDSNQSSMSKVNEEYEYFDRCIEVNEVQQAVGVKLHTKPIDIIVCVHNALDDTRRCLDSIVTHSTQPYFLILVNDGSDVQTLQYLTEFSATHSTELLTNDEAKGYTYAANQGLRRAKSDYVILINSDTIVSDEWLDRLAECIESNPRYGIVGPLSNTASWQSVPNVLIDGDWATNPLPEGMSIPDYARALSKYSARIYPSMALLNGFCMMIRRELIDDIGYFDEENFGEGYGEEDDYTLRARKAGWLLGLADDVFIYHAQSKSYSNERRLALSAQSGKILAEKHGQELINQSCSDSLDNRVLDGIRARCRTLSEREDYIRRGKIKFAGKRILFVLPVASPGGGANVIFDEALAMLDMGVDIRIFNLNENRMSFHESYPHIKIPVTFGAVDQLSSLMKLYDVAIATVYYSVDWLKMVKNPCTNIMGYYVQDFEPLFYAPGTKGYRNALDSYTKISKMVIFTKTSWTRNQILLSTGKESHVIGVSLNTELFRPRPRSIKSSNAPVVIAGMIRPWTPYREPVLTMEILKKIKERYGNKVRIKLFGCSLDELKNSNLSTEFTWELAGVLTQKQVAKFLNDVDIFVDFSSHQAMGLTALEAMASGCAVIVPQNGGTDSYAIHEGNCLIVDTCSPEACFSAVSRLIEDLQLRKTIQKKAVTDICAYYPEASAYRILETLFQGDGEGIESTSFVRSV